MRRLPPRVGHLCEAACKGRVEHYCDGRQESSSETFKDQIHIPEGAKLKREVTEDSTGIHENRGGELQCKDPSLARPSIHHPHVFYIRKR